MSSEWQLKTVGEFCPFKYGKGLPERDRKPGRIGVYSSAGLVGSHESAFVNSPGVVIGRKGTVGSVTYAIGPFWPIDTAFYVDDQPEIRDIRFTYYLLKTLDLHLMNTDSAVPGLNRDNAHALEVRIPPLETQQAIADFLQHIDDRIRLLRETNATLEAIAQALFKSWFVDFDPVRAKQEGRTPEGMDETTAALFPDSFEESELGLLPRGWEVRGIDETCDLGRGSSPRPIQKFMGGEVPWIKIADATASDGMFVFETKEAIIKEGVRNSVEVRHGDLIMSNSASCGITVFVELDGCIHDGWLYFKNYQHISKYFLFFWLRKIAAHLVRIADGSVQKNLNIALVSSQKIVCPSEEVVREFDSLSGPLLDRIRENCIQAQTLANLRDSLLPRLISGQLPLSELTVD